MHPEIEGAIREHARKFLDSMLHDNNPYRGAAEAGLISFDDIYFLGALNGAESITENGLIETDRAPVEELETEKGVFNIVVQDDPDFRNQVESRGTGLVAGLYNCTTEEIEARYLDINRKVTAYINKKVSEKRLNRDKSL